MKPIRTHIQEFLDFNIGTEVLTRLNQEIRVIDEEPKTLKFVSFIYDPGDLIETPTHYTSLRETLKYLEQSKKGNVPCDEFTVNNSRYYSVFIYLLKILQHRYTYRSKKKISFVWPRKFIQHHALNERKIIGLGKFTEIEKLACHILRCYKNIVDCLSKSGVSFKMHGDFKSKYKLGQQCDSTYKFKLRQPCDEFQILFDGIIKFDKKQKKFKCHYVQRRNQQSQNWIKRCKYVNDLDFNKESFTAPNILYLFWKFQVGIIGNDIIPFKNYSAPPNMHKSLKLQYSPIFHSENLKSGLVIMNQVNKWIEMKIFKNQYSSIFSKYIGFSIVAQLNFCRKPFIVKPKLKRKRRRDWKYDDYTCGPKRKKIRLSESLNDDEKKIKQRLEKDIVKTQMKIDEIENTENQIGQLSNNLEDNTESPSQLFDHETNYLSQLFHRKKKRKKRKNLKMDKAHVKRRARYLKKTKTRIVIRPSLY